MGIKKFNDALKTYCPHVIQTLSLKDLAGYKIAIDMSVYLYKFVKTDEKRWLNGLMDFLYSMKKNKLIPVCIFDGPNPPVEKKITQQKRREETAKGVEKLNLTRSYKNSIDEKIKKGIDNIDEDPEGEKFVESIKRCMGSGRSKSVFWNDYYSIRDALQLQIRTLENQTRPIDENVKRDAQEMLNAFGIANYTADGEAEGLCAHLTFHGVCDAAMSSDTDVLVYGAKIFLTEYDSRTETVKAIVFEDVLNGLGVTHDTLRDLAIFLGCDYNPCPDGKPFKIKGVKMDNYSKVVSYGFKKRLELFMEHGVTSLEEAEQYLVSPDEDISVEKLINYKRIREIFTATPPDLNNFPHPVNRPVNIEKLKELVKKYNISKPIAQIVETFAPRKVFIKTKYQIK